jgi:hypothetical protein
VRNLSQAVTRSTPPEVRYLLERLTDVEPYPKGVRRIAERLPGIAFFPGGTGLLNGVPFPKAKVMVLGHNQNSEVKFEKDLTDGRHPCQRSSTWRALLPFLKNSGIRPEDCFFTNFFMGLSSGDVSKGRFPGESDLGFVARCREYLAEQLKVQRPRVVLTLGCFVPPLVAPLAPQLSKWSHPKLTLAELDEQACAVAHQVEFEGTNSVICSVVALVHPSYRRVNVKHRRFQSHSGDEAEIAMVRNALKHCGM